VARFTGFCCSARCPRAWRVGRLSSSKGQNNLSLMLKRDIGVLVGAALVVALLAVLPAVAQAQEGRTPIQEAPVANRGADAASARVVARPGDTLWSISSEQLGPNATPRQIANGVERIYALNQDQIGADPNMIFAGQKFVLPPEVERQLPEPARAAPARSTTALARTVSTSQVAHSGTDRGSTPTSGESGRRDRKAPEAAVERKTLPDEEAVAAVPVVRSLAADSSSRSLLATLSGARAMVLLAASGLVESIVTDDQYAARKLLGWVITLASLGIGVFPIVLAIIRTARRKSRYRPVYGGRAYATPFAAFGNLHAEGDPQEATRSVPSEEHKPHADSGNSKNGSDSFEDASRHATVTPIARSRHRRLLRTRNRGAGRPPRDPTVSGARQSQVLEGASTER
jgi:LysM repeat protein